MVAHRPSALNAVDQVAVIQNGRMSAFGPKSEILRPQASPVEQTSPAVADKPQPRVKARVSA